MKRAIFCLLPALALALALAALAREEEAVNAELQKLYDEYLELEALLEE